MTPRVYNKRTMDYPKDAVYVGRPTPYGNPFIVGVHGKNNLTCVDAYRIWIKAPAQKKLREQIRRELKGRNLLCWCKPHPCHADVIRAIAND